MAENTKIEWADHTFNPWMGCTKVGPGCDNCYAETLLDKRMHIVQWGAGKTRVRTSLANWRRPILWNMDAQRLGIRFRVFCASLADVFDNEVPDQWRYDLWQLILATPNLDWLLLTKRIGNAKLREVYRMLSWPANVWLGTTICNQAEADRDIPKLLEIPAAVRFLSIEPLLGHIDLSAAYLPCPNAKNTIMDPETGRYECCRKCDYTGITGEFGVDWVIVGGESGGHRARPIHPEWVRSLRDQCATTNTPFLFKQWGEYIDATSDEPGSRALRKSTQDKIFTAAGEVLGAGYRSGKKSIGMVEGDWKEKGAAWMCRVGKSEAGRILDGITHDAFPKV
jgi:protein gp37